MIHGHHTTYSRQSCRCEPCRQAHAIYSRERLRSKRAGEPYTRDASKARRHLQMLLAAGFRMVELERAMGISNPRVKTILEDPDAKIYASTEAKVLGTSQADVYEHCRQVPSTVPTRMIRSLTSLGWGPGEISRVAGVHVQTIRSTRDKPRPRMGKDTAELIGQAYDQMILMPRPGGHYANQNRAYARRRRWEAPNTTDHWNEAA